MTAIPRRTLGRTGLEVGALGFGAMELRGAPKAPQLTEPQVGRLLGRVLDHGIDLIDTSIDYGASEERIGRHLASRRDEYVLTSKCGCAVDRNDGVATATRGVGPHDYMRANIQAGVEQSLRRLRTDRLDVLQVHLSPSVHELERCDVAETLERLREAGKVRFVGMSGTLPHLRDHIATGWFDVFQIPYSVVQPEHEDQLTSAAAAGAGVIVRGGAARGVPSGRARARAREPQLADRWRAAGLDDLLDGRSPMEFTLRFTLSHRDVTSAVVGTTNAEHLARNVAAASLGALPPPVVAEARRRVDAALAPGSQPASR